MTIFSKSQYSIKAVVGLSCYLSFGWEKIFQPKQKETMPNFFLGHGSEDPIVPIVVGKQARDDLQEKNISVVWKKYEAVPHTVCEFIPRNFGCRRVYHATVFFLGQRGFYFFHSFRYLRGKIFYTFFCE